MRLERYFFVFALLVVACSEPQFSSDDPQQPQGEATALLRLEVIGLEEPNKYAVRVHTPLELVTGKLFRVSDQTAIDLTDLSRNRSSFTDKNVIVGFRYRYEVRSDRTLYAGEVLIPTDLEISGTTFVESIADTSKLINRFHRIFFRKDAILNSDGGTFTINADEIISENGVIRTWDQNSPAHSSGIAKPSGDIFISVSRIRGHLSIEPMGQKGGIGIKGVEGLHGAAGVNGTTVDLSASSVPPSLWCIHQSDSSLVSRRADPSLLPTFQQWRESHPARGGKGGTGGPGYPGGPGNPGGKSGSVFLNIIELDPKTLSINTFGDNGGDGGPGGDGGQGGDGGPPGNIWHNNQCGNGKCCSFPPPQGPRGETGPLGRKGNSGPRGEPGNITINGEMQSQKVFP